MISSVLWPSNPNQKLDFSDLYKSAYMSHLHFRLIHLPACSPPPVLSLTPHNQIQTPALPKLLPPEVIPHPGCWQLYSSRCSGQKPRSDFDSSFSFRIHVQSVSQSRLSEHTQNSPPPPLNALVQGIFTSCLLTAVAFCPVACPLPFSQHWDDPLKNGLVTILLKTTQCFPISLRIKPKCSNR